MDNLFGRKCRKMILSVWYNYILLGFVNYKANYNTYIYIYILSKKDLYSKNCYMQRSTEHIKGYKKRDKSKSRK